MFRSILLIAITWFAFAVVPAKADASAVSCAQEPGASLCRSIRVMNSYIVNCSGGCDNLFSSQQVYFNQVADTYYGDINPGTAVASDLGSLAQATATKLCAYQWTNVDTSVLSNLVTAANRALGALAEIQQLAGIQSPTTCTMSIQ